jgi:hypothetical protein
MPAGVATMQAKRKRLKPLSRKGLRLPDVLIKIYTFKNMASG